MVKVLTPLVTEIPTLACGTMINERAKVLWDCKKTFDFIHFIAMKVTLIKETGKITCMKVKGVYITMIKFYPKAFTTKANRFDLFHWFKT